MGSTQRLEAWKLTAFEQGLIDAECKLVAGCGESLLFNITQNTSFSCTCTPDICPSLLRNSILYDVGSRTCLLPAEHWLVQGFPHPCAGIESQWFPFPEVVEPSASAIKQVSSSAQRSLTGNAMHWSQISTWVLYSMLTQISTIHDFCYSMYTNLVTRNIFGLGSMPQPTLHALRL